MKKVLFKLDFRLGLVAALLMCCCSKNDGTDPIPRQTQIFNIDPTSGMVGEYVVIEGKDFGDWMEDNTVKFNDHIASIITASTTRLVVKVPEDATSGPITIAVNGKIVTSATDFEIIPQ